MKISKLLSPDLIKTELETHISDDILEIIKPELRVERIKELLIREFVDLLNLSGKVQSENKLYLDLLNRERKASTAIGEGIAIPHVRTMHVREFLMGFAKSTSGYEYDSPDGGKTHLFFMMVSPEFSAEGPNLHLLPAGAGGVEHVSHLFAHWVDPFAVLAVGGLWVWMFLGELKKRPLLAIGDPYLREALQSGGGGH